MIAKKLYYKLLGSGDRIAAVCELFHELLRIRRLMCARVAGRV